jgi:hypothetical protein
VTDPPEYRDSPTTGRWLRILGIVAVIVLLLLVVAMLVGRGGGHGPARHIGATRSLDMEV